MLLLLNHNEDFFFVEIPGIFFFIISVSVVKISEMKSGPVYLYLDLKAHALAGYGYCCWLPSITNW